MTEDEKGPTLTEFSQSLARLVESVSISVVEIRSGRRGFASGFVWRPGLVVTADEALADCDSASVTVDDHTLQAAVLGRDPSTDIAVLGVSGLGAPALSLAAGFTPRRDCAGGGAA